MAKKREIDVEIDELTNSIVNILTGDVLIIEIGAATSINFMYKKNAAVCKRQLRFL